MPAHILEPLVARWDRTGVTVSGWEECEQAAPTDSDRSRFVWVRDLARRLGVERLEDGVALAVLTAAPGWEDQFFHAVLRQPLLTGLDHEADLVPLVEPWPKAFDRAGLQQVRTLARLYLLPRAAPADQALATLLALFDRVPGEGPGMRGLLDESSPTRRALLARALPFWRTRAMAPALLAKLRAELESGSAGELPATLGFAKDLLRRAGQPPDDLPRGLAAVLWEYEQVKGTPEAPAPLLLQLTELHGAIRQALGLEPVGADPLSWYRDADGLVRAFPKESRRPLKDVWVKDVLLGWVSAPPGSYLTAALYRTWCELRRTPGGPTGALTEDLGALMRDAPAAVGYKPRTAVELILGEEVGREATPQDAARLCRETVRMSGSPLAEWVKVRLLARILQEPAAAGDAALLSAWADADGHLEKAVGRLGHALGGGAKPEDIGLLWEVLLSPRSRRPGLRARLLRMVNLGEMRGQAAGWSELVGDVLRALCDPAGPAGAQGA